MAQAAFGASAGLKEPYGALHWFMSALFRPANGHEIIQSYKAGIACAALAITYGVSVGTMTRFMRANGITLRTSSEVQRKHTFNERYFDDINTEQKAYWLGFLMADGCIVRTDGSPRLSVILGAKDEAHLRKLKSALSSEHPVKVREYTTNFGRHKRAEFNIRSVHLCGALEQKGVSSRTPIPVFIAPVPASLVRHYWRGTFDGDGSVWFSNAIQRWHAAFCGRRDIVEAFARTMNSLSGSKATARTSPGMYRYEVTDRTARAVLAFLYEDAVISLDRKLLAARAAIVHGALGKQRLT